MTGARQTMLTWARVLDSFEEVPEPYRQSYQELLPNSKTFPYTVLVPPQVNQRGNKSPEHLLCEIDGVFFALEHAENSLSTYGFRYQDINGFELGNILLYSWFTLHGKPSTGSETTLRIEFNEATKRHFDPLFRKFRPDPIQTDLAAWKAEKEKLIRLATINYKFMNFAGQSLVEGENVVQFVYQPRIRQKTASLLGHDFFRTAAMEHLAILTDQEIILIGEAEHVSEKMRGKYGGVRTFLPLRSLHSVSLEESANGFATLTFQVGPEIQFRGLFDPAHLPEAREFQRLIQRYLG